MKGINKYSKQFFTAEGVSMDWIKKEAIEKAGTTQVACLNF